MGAPPGAAPRRLPARPPSRPAPRRPTRRRPAAGVRRCSATSHGASVTAASAARPSAAMPAAASTETSRSRTLSRRAAGRCLVPAGDARPSTSSAPARRTVHEAHRGEPQRPHREAGRRLGWRGPAQRPGGLAQRRQSERDRAAPARAAPRRRRPARGGVEGDQQPMVTPRAGTSPRSTGSVRVPVAASCASLSTCLPIRTLVHSRPYGTARHPHLPGQLPHGREYVPAIISGPHTSRTSSSPRPRAFSRSGGVAYATDSTRPASAKATTGHPRCSAIATSTARSTAISPSTARPTDRRRTIPDRIGCGRVERTAGSRRCRAPHPCRTGR
jgi:hypothetical protein